MILSPRTFLLTAEIRDARLPLELAAYQTLQRLVAETHLLSTYEVEGLVQQLASFDAV